MNKKIYSVIIKQLAHFFDDPVTRTTNILELPWKLNEFDAFKSNVILELGVSASFIGSIEEVVIDLDTKYLEKYFGSIWQPTTEQYTYSGWALVELINNTNPTAVLDVGCGYNQFKGKIQNLTGVDPFNVNADYHTDILDFNGTVLYDHILVLGSLNFNEQKDIEIRLQKIVSLLAPGGKIYCRVNPGIDWSDGPYVDIFAWDINLIHKFAFELNLEVDTFKHDDNNRYFFIYKKPLFGPITSYTR